MKSEWVRYCPDCGKEITYSYKRTYDKAVLNDTKCRSCCLSDKSKARISQSLSKYYEENEVSEETVEKIKSKITGLKRSDETKRRLSESKLGSKNPMYGRSGELSPAFGIPSSELKKKKMRQSAIRRISRTKFPEGQSLRPNFNPTACQLIDEYGKEHGFNFQHAMNGGEIHIKELGYFVDGYDEEKNVVIEYYEMAHKRTKKRDARRKREIVEHLGCEFIELKEWEVA